MPLKLPKFGTRLWRGSSFLSNDFLISKEWMRTSSFSAKKEAKTGTKCSSAKLNSSLEPRSALRSKTFDTKVLHPITIVKNLSPVSSQARFLGDKLSNCEEVLLALSSEYKNYSPHFCDE